MKYNPAVTVPAPIKSNAALGWLEDTETSPVARPMSEGAYWEWLTRYRSRWYEEAYCAPFNTDPSLPARDVIICSNRCRERLEKGSCRCCALRHSTRGGVGGVGV
jgi:hypothetical protein